jgi:flagellar biosynthesis/type III secretory pathway protein FliH
MSDHKTAKTVQFPVLEEAPPKKPHWLEDGQGKPVRKLFEPALEEPALPPGLSPNEKPAAQPAPPPSRQPSAASMYPPAPEPEPGQAAAAATQAAAQQAAAQRAAEAHAAQRAADASAAANAARNEHREPHEHEHEPHAAEERAMPPTSLIPGARSAPPPAPANDIGVELLMEQREAFTHAALELALARAATLSVLEGQLLDLSIEIAESLIERELEQQPELHTTLARAALASLGDAERVTLRTSPSAFEAICQTLGGPETTVSGVHVVVHADETIPGLGCIVDGENVRIDATVAERLRAVRRAFEDERRKKAEATE